MARLTNDIDLFISMSYICNLSLFTLSIHRFAQDTIWPGQRVEVESGGQRRAIGQIFDTVNSVATDILAHYGGWPYVAYSLAHSRAVLG